MWTGDYSCLRMSSSMGTSGGRFWVTVCQRMAASSRKYSWTGDRHRLFEDRRPQLRFQRIGPPEIYPTPQQAFQVAF